MKIQILHFRDPDGACDISVYVDGVLAPHEEESVDPGAGHSRAGWDERIAEAREALYKDESNFNCALYDYLTINADSNYITED